MPNYICNECGKAFEAQTDKDGKITCPYCNVSLVAAELDQPLAAGSRIKGYEIIRHIASGGSGDVYLAEQVAMERKVALKILNTRQMDQDSIQRFLEEARNTAKFENPHVVTVLDVGIAENGCYFLATRYVEGETLESLLNRGHIFSEKETLSVALDIGEALHSIWDKFKMFHKDIKPGNIMLTPEGEAVILDMGIAQEWGASVLINGKVEGSPYYMSPEQAHGEELNWSTDLYSLGTTLYQMVTGVCPYDAPDVEEILQQHEHAPFPEPSERVPGIQVSEPMTALIRKMMGKTPADRFGSWKEFLYVAGKLRRELAKMENKPVPLPAYPGNRDNDDRKRQYSVMRFAIFGILLLLLAGGFAAGLLLHFASRKNSVNVRKMLDAVHSDISSPDWNPEKMEKRLKQIQPYTKRFGVQPSLRYRYNEYCRQTQDRKKKIQQEAKQLADWEYQTADVLITAEKYFDAAKTAENARQIGEAEKQYAQAHAKLLALRKKILSKKMIDPGHAKRAAGLLKRLDPPFHIAARKKITARLQIREESLLRQREAARLAAEKRKERVHQQQLKQEEAARKANALKIQKEKERRQFLQYQTDAQTFQRHCVVFLILQKIGVRYSVKLPDFAKGPAGTEKIWVQSQQFLKDVLNLQHQGLDFWKEIYDSKQKFKDMFFFTVPNEGKNMRLYSIHGDKVVLYKSGEFSKIIPMDNLLPAELSSFLQYASRQLKKERQYESFRFLAGDFSGLQKHCRNPLIQRWLPFFRHIWYGYLSGDQIPGISENSRPSHKEILTRYGTDSAFWPYRKRMEKENKSKKTSNKK